MYSTEPRRLKKVKIEKDLFAEMLLGMLEAELDDNLGYEK